jgi:energy-coupling factor transporter ATP-binding protein EcfA2
VFQLSRARLDYGEKVVLDDVTLAFLPGAKIGVLGPNGAGKSTLLRLMAGLQQPSNGEARLALGVSVGILPQEPQRCGADPGVAGFYCVLSVRDLSALDDRRVRGLGQRGLDPVSVQVPNATPAATRTSSSATVSAHTFRAYPSSTCRRVPIHPACSWYVTVR